MTAGLIIFSIVAAIAVIAAFGLLTATNAVHAALFLVVNFFCVALFYLGLNAPFLAVVQVTVYAGAIMVLFLFVIMLLGAEKVSLESHLRWQAPLAVVLTVALIGISIYILVSPEVGLSLANPEPLGVASTASEGYGSPAAVGISLFVDYVLPFQIVGVLLLVAMMGAVVLTREDKKPRAHRYRWQELQEQMRRDIPQYMGQDQGTPGDR